MSADVWGHGEEGVVCPGCGSRDVDVDEARMDGEPEPAKCRTCGRGWLAAWADPQCGECREFLPDGAEDDSLCEACSGQLLTDAEKDDIPTRRCFESWIPMWRFAGTTIRCFL